MGLQKNIDEDLLKEYLNNPRLRYFDRMMENIYRDTRQYQNDIGMLVETFRNGTRTLGPGKYTAEYTPEIINQEGSPISLLNYYGLSSIEQRLDETDSNYLASIP